MASSGVGARAKDRLTIGPQDAILPYIEAPIHTRRLRFSARLNFSCHVDSAPPPTRAVATSTRYGLPSRVAAIPRFSADSKSAAVAAFLPLTLWLSARLSESISGVPRDMPGSWP